MHKLDKQICHGNYKG